MFHLYWLLWIDMMLSSMFVLSRSTTLCDGDILMTLVTWRRSGPSLSPNYFRFRITKDFGLNNAEEVNRNTLKNQFPQISTNNMQPLIWWGPCWSLLLAQQSTATTLLLWQHSTVVITLLLANAVVVAPSFLLSTILWSVLSKYSPDDRDNWRL